MPSKSRILILDADLQHGRQVGAGLSHGAEPAEADCCATPDQLLALVEAGPADAALLDMDLPGIDLRQLIVTLRAKTPELPVILMAARVDHHAVGRACAHGATAIVGKPCDLENLSRVLEAPISGGGFVGTARGVPTASLLALHCGTAAHGILHLRLPERDGVAGRSGTIHLEHGQPVHATTDGAVGPEAVQEMLGWVDADATWLPGGSGCPRTIVGRWEGLLSRPRIGDYEAGGEAGLEGALSVAYPDVVDKLSRLAQTPDVMGAFLLRHAQVLTGRCESQLDPALAARALSRLSHVFHDVAAQPAHEAGSEIQTIVGGIRLVLDRVGPPEAGYQVGVVVRQASPICKSLRRLLRQIDRAFLRAMGSKGGKKPSTTMDRPFPGERHVA